MSGSTPGIGTFVIGTSPIGFGFDTSFPLQQIIPSYVYLQYSDDQAAQAFAASFNTLAQGYLNWFNATPLGLYIAQSGLLLDWTAQGIYGIARPTLSTSSTSTTGAYNTKPYNTTAYNAHIVTTTGTATLASDDIYQRVLTWWLYKGDGQQMTLQWLKKRVSRFLYGAGGGDISYPVAVPPSVEITPATLTAGFSATYNTRPYNTIAYGGMTRTSGGSIIITVPNNSIGQALQLLVQDGLLALPFQYPVTVVL